MNKKAEISVTVTVLLLLAVATFGGATFYIWYTNYLRQSEAEAEGKPLPGESIATIMNIGNDTKTLYVTIRNNEYNANMTIPVEGHVVGEKESSTTHSCNATEEVMIEPRKRRVVEIQVNDLRLGAEYYILIEIECKGNAYMIRQNYTPT
ncbi:MAG: hypothetical protein U9N35_07185 [Euryarchaeota archaeon]|nr:hypothetical protein [Euryarchaeota archaeon]